MADTVREGHWAQDAVLARLREKERPELVGKAEVLIFNILLFCPLLSPMALVAGVVGRGSQTVAHIPHECSIYLPEMFPEHLRIPTVCARSSPG